MKSNLAQLQDTGQVDRVLEWLLRLPQLPPGELPRLADIEATVAALTAPASPVWCMARVASLLSPYYDKDTPQSVRELEAEDWLEALGGFPQWAIDRAVRWWKGAENPDRRKRPLEGDIAARCRVEMRGIGSVPKLVEMKARAKPEPVRVVSPEDAEHRRRVSAEIMARFSGCA